jgi:predicted GIY-YIG superfamily endonuclease
MSKPIGYWTKERCHQEALKYKTKSEFKNANDWVYKLVLKNKWMDEFSTHMTVSRRFKKYWTKELCVEIAKACSSKEEFIKKYAGAYYRAVKEGWVDECYRHLPEKHKPYGYWTKHKCAEEALKYTSRKDFQKKCESAYSKASKEGWLDDICGHMIAGCKPKGYWNKQRCGEVAKTCVTKIEYQKKYPLPYRISCTNGWIDEICGHMVKPPLKNVIWTKERCREVSKTCGSRNEFIKRFQVAYNKARRKGWLDDICNHMKPLPTLHQRLIYAYEFKNENSVYVGLTYNPKDRDMSHRVKGSVFEFALEKNITVPEIKILTTYFSPSEASKMEREYVKKYKQDGWNIINKAKPGTLGAGLRKWNLEKIKYEALKYSSRGEFCKKSPIAYATALKRKWLNNVCEHMSEPKKPKSYWTYETCKELATKCSSRTEFLKKSQNAHNVSIINGWLDEFFPIKKKKGGSCVGVIQYTREGIKLVEYDSMIQAALAVGVKNSTSIGICCRHKRLSVGGFIWEYSDRELQAKFGFYFPK